MFTLQLQQSVLDSLRNLKSIDTLKKLFWSQLNYERINQPLSRRKLTEAVANEMIEEPLLLASGGNNNAFHVIYSRLKSEELSRQGERKIVNHLLKEHPYALFIFSNKSHSRWHFLNVKYDNTLQKRKLFRRITIGEDEQLRTASEIISRLDLEDIPANASPLEIQTRHDQEFDVEAVTQEFFNTYRQIFEKVEELIQGIGGNERKRLFTQKLFNRLMFIAFIQKKGWLKFQGKTDYLSVLWEDYQDHHTNATTNFYRDRLSHLFFAGLNNAQQADVIGINNGGFLKNLIGNVPYLNGGLFEQDEDDNNPQIIIPDECIDAILHDLFQRFAFTVTESTPLDVDVAVDPEMLGKVFEELVTGRHESGSYYTPKPIVSFMCREALKGYLKTAVPGESSDAISQYIDEHIPDDLANSGAIFDALRRVRCCDLACGSGAYLLGMLHELLDLRNCLFASKKIGTDSTYNTKLEIIENNLYGVDVDIFAVNIARLRLWLSLAVDYEGEQPKPLPNLKYKIEVGDSLIADSPTTTGQIRHVCIQEYRQKKAEYMRTHEGGKKQRLEKEINELKTQIRLFSYGNCQASAGFDWAVEFAEVFADGGFDIVVANPPYVRMELFKNIKPTLKNNFTEVHSDRADLYCYFYARALQLLRSGGMLVFISSNKWLRAKYGEKLRKHIADTCEVHSITDFGELPVFQSASTFPMIFIAKKDKKLDQAPIFTQITTLDSPYPELLILINNNGQRLAHDDINNSNWNLTNADSNKLIKQMEFTGISLNEYIQGRIYRGVASGYNNAFYIDENIKEKLIRQNSANLGVIKPLLVGDNIRKWRMASKNKYLLYMYHKIDVSNLSYILEYLEKYRKNLENRAIKQEWYELQQPQFRYAAEFEKPKIIFPDIVKEPRFTFDKEGHYLANTAYIIPVNDLYLLGVLNSRYIWEYAKSRFVCLGDPNQGGRLRFTYQSVINLPIPIASTTEKETISQLVQKCLDAKGVNCETWEKEIDERVAALYGL